MELLTASFIEKKGASEGKGYLSVHTNFGLAFKIQAYPKISSKFCLILSRCCQKPFNQSGDRQRCSLCAAYGEFSLKYPATPLRQDEFIPSVVGEFLDPLTAFLVEEALFQVVQAFDYSKWKKSSSWQRKQYLQQWQEIPLLPSPSIEAASCRTT